MNLEKILLVICIVLLIAACAFCVFLLHKMKKSGRSDKDANLIDPQTGLASKAALQKYFTGMREKNYKAVYYMAYIGFDIKKYTQVAGEDRANEIFLHAADFLKKQSENDFMCRYAGGTFIDIRVCASEKDAEKWIRPLLTSMNEEIYGDKHDTVTLFRAGLLKLKASDWVLENVCSLAEKCYLRAVDKGIPYCIPHADEVRANTVSKMLGTKINKAVDDGEMNIFFQPIVSAETSRINGFEALSRWNDPELGLIGPGRYIDILAEKGKIRDHDLKLLEQVVVTLEKWHKEGKAYWISANLTRETISSETLIDEIKRIVEAHEFDHHCLTIEITEDSIVKQKEIAKSNLMALRDMDINIALDDLGSGYTFFADLIDYPFTTSKMDRCLLLETETEKGKALMKGLIETCHLLGMKVVCEGVEKGTQLELVRELGADFIQGFYFYRPMNTEEAEKVLADEA